MVIYFKSDVFWILILIVLVRWYLAVEIDILECGVDTAPEVSTGDVPLNVYPWLGILYYSFFGEAGEQRSITTVALIQEEFVIGPAADIAPMPKHDFRKNSRVLLGHDWRTPGRRVRSYVIHPEYDQTYNTIALVQLKDVVTQIWIKPLCPPPQRLINPEFYVVKFKEEYKDLQKEVIPMGHVPGELCKEFYVRANLDMSRMRPPHVACAATLVERTVCVWDAGATLVTRDVWGRWQLLGIGTRGPGCGAPSRYLDIMAYQPWILDSLHQFTRLSISKINNQNFVLRSGNQYQRFGACDEEEKTNLVYRERMLVQTDNYQFQFATYNMTILQNVEFSCLTLELVNCSATSEMNVKHYCTRRGQGLGNACYKFLRSTFDIMVSIMYSGSCLFEMVAWGHERDMNLINPATWRREEGTYYADFAQEPTEYKGPFWMTEFGFEPLEEEMWFPKFDYWTTTEFDPLGHMTTTELALLEAPERFAVGKYYFTYEPTTTPFGFLFKKKTTITEEPRPEEEVVTIQLTTVMGIKPFHRKSTTPPPPNVTLIPGGFLFPRWG